MKNFNILDRNTQIPRHLFLEASAGTGKTFAIENLIVRQILDFWNMIVDFPSHFRCLESNVGLFRQNFDF